MARFVGMVAVVALGLLSGCSKDGRPEPSAPEGCIFIADSLDPNHPIIVVPHRLPDTPPSEQKDPYFAGIIKPDTTVDHKIIIIPPGGGYRLPRPDHGGNERLTPVPPQKDKEREPK